ncbi:ImmA/IrrE family metallo-endopeptidase [Paenibacillus sp. PL2-23]|uniref:ImmA/IrrE family metallo-endopeptidase n=1 Tax=Paenibacillus sp. PL2-23 TaxID=2100729 RepID=UPI0030FCBB9C
MEALNFELYRPAEMELWIGEMFHRSGLRAPADLNDWDKVASLFGAHIAYTEGETKVLYDEEGDCLIFLNIHMDKHRQKLAFFHELSHPALHTGNQRQLPQSFVALQETQAGLFQLYSAMPIHMLQAFVQLHYHPQDVRLLAEAFDVPPSFVRKRLDRIAGRIRQQRSDRQLRERIAGSSESRREPYSDMTNRLLRQLYRQTEASRSAGMTKG